MVIVKFLGEAQVYCYKMASKEDDLKNAVRSSDKDLVVKLLDQGVNPNGFGSSSGDAKSPLMIACLITNVELIKLLISRGAKVDLQNNSRQTALTKVINSKNMKQSEILEVTKTLVEHNSTQSHFSEGMKVACKKGNEEVARLLLPYGSCLDDDLLEWFYRAAVQNGHASIVKLLTGGEHTKELASEKWVELLYLACETKDDPEMVGIVLDYYPAIVNDTCGLYCGEYEGSTALMWASARGYTKVVKLLLDRGAKIDYQNQTEHDSYNERGGFSALMVAAKYSQLDTMKLLLDEGANVDLKNKGGKTALMISASLENQGRSLTSYQCAKMVEMLLNKGANVDIEDQKRATALTYAITNRSLEAVKLLLASEANVNKGKNFKGDSPLQIATKHAQYYPEYVEIVQLLVQKGATVDICDDFSKEPPLIVACRYGNAELSKLFIEKGATVNHLVHDGGYALLYAVKYAADQYRYKENPLIFQFIELLLEKGAKYDIFTEKDESALSVMQTNATLLTVSSLVPRPRLPRKWVWYFSSDFLYLLTQQSWILTCQSESLHVTFHVT